MFFECTPVTLSSAGFLAGLFMAGLVGGFSHCLFMCAPFVVTLHNTTKKCGRLSSTLLLPYHAGRMTTYVALGILAQLFLSYAFPSSLIRALVSAIILSLAALVFLMQALPQLSRYFPFLIRIHSPISLCGIRTQVGRLLELPTPFSLYGAGVMLGFIPCGLVMGVLLAVATADTWEKAGIGMVAFTLGTVPSLVVVALGGSSLATLFPRGWGLLSRWVFVLNGIVLFVLAGQHIMTFV